MKAYVDIKQCKKLAEILSLGSADMSYTLDFDSGRYYISMTPYKSWVVPKYAESYKGLNQVLPCWSLAALLEVLPEYNLQRTDWGYKTEYKIVVTIKDEDNYVSKNYDNPLDACIDMILQLKERSLI